MIEPTLRERIHKVLFRDPEVFANGLLLRAQQGLSQFFRTRSNFMPLFQHVYASLGSPYRK
jgi:hypothetical protein